MSSEEPAQLNIRELMQSHQDAVLTTISLVAINTAALREARSLNAHHWMGCLVLLSNAYAEANNCSTQDVQRQVDQQIAMWRSLTSAEVQA